MTEANEIFSYPAKVLSTRALDMPTMMDMLKSKVFDPSVLDGREPFFWPAEISNSLVDFYSTHMMPTTLQNYANESEIGISFMNSHRHDELPMGRSLSGRLEQAGDGQRVVSDFYTLPGITLNGVRTDDFIAGVRSGIIRDISVGFYGGQYWCDVCHQNYRSMNCSHIAGVEYEVQGGGKVVCTVGIDGAHLAEVSAVYDGATPNATILKAQRMVAENELKPEEIRFLESHYRMKFSSKRSFPSVDVDPKAQKNAAVRSAGSADDEPQGGKKLEFEQIVNQVREVLAVGADTDLVSTVLSISSERERLKTEVDTATKELDTLRVKVAELTPQAKDGAQYRADLIAEALAEGVRAMGDKFNAETYTNVLSNASLDVVKQMKADWAVIGNSRFSGGRKTTDEGEQAPGVKPKTARRYAPETAYQS